MTKTTTEPREAQMLAAHDREDDRGMEMLARLFWLAVIVVAAAAVGVFL